MSAERRYEEARTDATYGTRGRFSDVGVAEARRRFGGLDVPASLVGMLTALAMVIILGGIAAAIIGSIGYQTGVRGNTEELSIGGLIAGLVVLFLSFLVGGWAAGRMARYDGGVNGVMTAVWTLILGAILAGLGAWLGSEYDVFARVNAPQFFSSDAFTTSAIITGILALAVMLLGGWLGGLWGQRFHRAADSVIAGTRDTGVVHDYDGPTPLYRDRTEVVETEAPDTTARSTYVETTDDRRIARDE